MKTKFLRALLPLAVFAAYPAMAHAAPEANDSRHHHHHHQAPEVDPSLAPGALALLGGATMILRERRKLR